MTSAGTLYEALQAQGGGSGLLTYVSATQIKFAPYNGSFIRIEGEWATIPSGGITAANTSVYVNGVASQNLAGSTNYFVYLFDNAGTPTIDFSTTGHVTSATAYNVGTEIKSGTESRSLIGYIRTNASAQFVDAAGSRFVRSWFNRNVERLGMAIGRGTQFTTTSTSFVTLAMLVDFLTWEDEIVTVSLAANAFNTAGNAWATTFWWDGAATSANHGAYASDGSGNWTANSYAESKMLTEGYHTVTPAVRNVSGTGLTIGGGAPGVYPSLTARIN